MKTNFKSTLILALALGLVLPTAYAAEEAAPLLNPALEAKDEAQLQDPEDADLTIYYTEEELADTPEFVENVELAEEAEEPSLEDEEIDDPEEEIDETIDVGERDWHYNKFLMTYKLSGKTYSIDTVIGELLPGPGYDEHLVKLNQLKKAAAGSNVDFEILSQEAESLTIKNANKQAKISLYTYEGDKYVDLYEFSDSLGLRARIAHSQQDLDYKNMVVLIDATKSDVYEASVTEVKEDIKKNDYTLIYAYDSERVGQSSDKYSEINAVERFVQYLNEQNKYRFGSLGFVSDYKAFTHDEMNYIYDKNKPMWKIYGLTDEVNEFFKGKLNIDSPDYTFDGLYIMDKNYKFLGRDLLGYQYELGNIYYNLPTYDSENREYENEEAYLLEVALSNALDYSIEGKKISEKDLEKNILKPIHTENKDKPEQKYAYNAEKEQKTPNVKVSKVQKQAPKASTNPKTVVGSILAPVAIAAVAAIALKKTK